MEDTQMPSASTPQVPQQEANTNPPASSPEPVNSPTPKKGGGLIKTLVGVFAIAILGFGGWYAYNSGLFGGDSDDTPPALTIGGAGFQGKSVDTTFGFLQFDASDVSNFVDSGMNLATATKGVNYFAPKTNTSFADIAESIKPAEDLKWLLVKYDKTEPWAGDTSKNGCFKTYPVGPYENTCEVQEAALGSTIVMEGEAIAMIANNNFEYDSNLLADAKTLGNTLDLSDAKGWSMHPLSATMDLSDSRIKSLWVQKNQNEFEKVTDIASIDPTREYKMAWFKIGTSTATGDATGGGDSDQIECGNGTIESGEQCDDGSGNSDTVADACRNTCVISACGDGVVDTGEECDGGTDCEADCTLSVAAPVCGDGTVDADAGEECDDGNTTDDDVCMADCTLPLPVEECGNDVIDGTDVCDGTDLGGKTCADYVTDSIYDAGALGCAADCSAYNDSACTTTPGDQTPVCGNSVVEANEECDDGNTADGDGCDSECKTESQTNTNPFVGNLRTLDKSRLSVGSQGADTTNAGNAVLSKVEYINNIGTALEQSHLEGSLSAFEKGNLYGNKDDDANGGKHIITAVKVFAGGNTGSITLDEMRYYSTGTKAGDTMLSLEYCIGDGNVEVYKITPKDDNTGVVRLLVGKDQNKNFKLEKEEILTNANTIAANSWAIYYVVITGGQSCHDESKGAMSESTADVSMVRYIQSDETKKTIWKTDMEFKDAYRKILWS